MAEHIKLTAFPRERTGTGGARAVRREGRVPAIVYGGGEAPLMLALVAREVRRELTMNPHFFNAICELDLDGKTLEALPREAQLHPVNDEALHLDFIRVSKDTVVTVEVPVHFLNEEKSKGLRRGGVLNIVRHEIEVSCPAEAIPGNIEIDLSGYDIGDSIHISAVMLPDGVKPTITDRDFTIATIAAPTVTPAEEEETATATPTTGTTEED